MLNKLFTKPLTLTVGGQAITFDTLAEFEFCLAGRTEIPAKKMAALVALSPDELKLEASTIKAIEQQFVDILQRSIESPGSIANNIRDIDPHVFTQDHGWRDIMLALNEKGHDYDELRRVALVKYMQYLTSRQEVIKHTYAMRRSRNERNVPTTSANEGEQVGTAPLAGMNETVVLDTSVLLPRDGRSEEFRRLPKGEAVVLLVQPGQSIELRLARHPFRLLVKDALHLVDDGGVSHRLSDGKNIIGRDTVCNVVVDGRHRDVSRLHLIIERQGREQLRLTDLSSHGTRIASSLLARASVDS